MNENMRSTRFLLPLVAVLALAVSCGKKVQEPGPLKPIVILYENDVHCAIEGYAAFAGLRDEIAAPDTAYVALVSSGDYLQGGSAGSLTLGESVMQMIDAVGYDAMGLGNHEFDYYTPQLLALLNGHHPPVTCLNLYDKDGKAVLPPYIIRTYGPKKVAFVGVLTPETMTAERYAFYDEADELLYDLRNDDLAILTQQAVDAARAAGADYVVLLSHLGEEPEYPYAGSHDIVAATRGIDVVLDGHTHSVIPCEMVANRDGVPVPVSQTGTAFHNIGKLTIATDGSISVELIPTESVEARSEAVAAKLASVQQSLVDIISVPVGESEVDLLITDGNGERMVRKAETNTGDLLCDAMRSAMGTDIAISNGGGIRADVPAGPLVYGDINNIFPFINYLCKIEATGQEILDVLEHCTSKAPAKEDGDFPQCSGIRYTVHTATHRVSDVFVLDGTGQWKALDPAATYTVATINYCVRGGGFGRIWAACKVLEQSEILYCDAVVKFISHALGGHIGPDYAKPQGRITFVNN